MSQTQDNAVGSEQSLPVSFKSDHQANKGIIATNALHDESRKSKEADPILVNLLQRGKLALSQLKLLTPEENNANMYYQAALGRDSKNSEALFGLARIVQHYTDFAWAKARKQQFIAAQKYLDSASSVNPDDPLIKETAERIKSYRSSLKSSAQAKIQSKNVIKKEKSNLNQYFLPKTLFSLPEEEILKRIQPIIDKVAAQQATLEINWVNDKEARLLYQIINSRVLDFRVRGMIFHRPSYMIEVKQQ
ncbi:hypothetical protein [Marinomonas sp. 2405UD68-3]|uniref:hypothetical protein n=1 Tax=Marinomonas sp. 2405UD68-3 TaxID=3391835 RepID=UPI0039C8FB5D